MLIKKIRTQIKNSLKKSKNSQTNIVKTETKDRLSRNQNGYNLKNQTCKIHKQTRITKI